MVGYANGVFSCRPPRALALRPESLSPPRSRCIRSTAGRTRATKVRASTCRRSRTKYPRTGRRSPIGRTPELPATLTDCTVRDRKNWECWYKDRAGRLSMTDSAFHDEVLKAIPGQGYFRLGPLRAEVEMVGRQNRNPHRRVRTAPIPCKKTSALTLNQRRRFPL